VRWRGRWPPPSLAVHACSTSWRPSTRAVRDTRDAGARNPCPVFTHYRAVVFDRCTAAVHAPTMQDANACGLCR
jgi:hypothetical protein